MLLKISAVCVLADKIESSHKRLHHYTLKTSTNAGTATCLWQANLSLINLSFNSAAVFASNRQLHRSF